MKCCCRGNLESERNGESDVVLRDLGSLRNLVRNQWFK